MKHRIRVHKLRVEKVSFEIEHYKRKLRRAEKSIDAATADIADLQHLIKEKQELYLDSMAQYYQSQSTLARTRGQIMCEFDNTVQRYLYEIDLHKLRFPSDTSSRRWNDLHHRLQTTTEQLHSVREEMKHPHLDHD